MRVDKKIDHKCHENSFNIHQSTYSVSHSSNVNNLDLDPRIIYEDRGSQPIGDVKECEQ